MDVQDAAAMRREDRHQVIKGRGAISNPDGRFEATRLEAADDGWGSPEEPPRRPDMLLIADLLSARLAAACRRSGLEGARGPELDCSQFRGDPAAPRQVDLSG
jgi:hypothetical protein